MTYEIIHIFAIVQVLHQISVCAATVETSGQAFIQTDNELTYMVDGVSLNMMPNQNLQDIRYQDGDTHSGSITFEPPLLEFSQQPVGMPHIEKVTIHNPDTKNSIHLHSISGSTLHFHCSFFQEKVIPPGGNTTFEVLFLAREEGNVEDTLYIHTSQRPFTYQVFGVGTANPYRIQPFLGAKVPLNSSFTPLIHLHNPHSSTLQVEEIYTSGGDLHLELPSGEIEASRELWEIPPYETKPIMKANFVGRVESKHIAFIRIKTNKETQENMLVLPVEVEVSSAPGIYSTMEKLDFGLVRSHDSPKTVKLNLLNSGDTPIHISEVTISPLNPALFVEFRPVSIQPGIHKSTTVATLTYHAGKAIVPMQWSGKIIVKSKGGTHKLNIPYQASVLQGSLVCDRNKTLFFTGHNVVDNSTHDIPIINTFKMNIVIFNITLPKEAESMFTIEKFKGPVTIEPQTAITPFRLKFHPNASYVTLTTEFIIHTNASQFKIPLYVYNGKLTVKHHRPEIFKGQLDFGTLGTGEKRSMTFTLRNDNPVEILIKSYEANMEGTLVELVGIEKGNSNTLTRKFDVHPLEINPLILKPNHFAVFSTDLVAPSYEGTFAAEVIMHTQFQHLYIPMTLRTAEGSLNAIPEKIVFEKCFPGKVSSKELRIHSSFLHYMEVRDITFNPNDTRFFYLPPKERPVLLSPDTNNPIGRLYFDMTRQCAGNCYLGLSTANTAGQLWLEGSTLKKEVADTDQYLYTRLRQNWEAEAEKEISVTIQLDTNQVRGFLFHAQAQLEWPALTRKKHLRFPLTQIGNISIGEFIVENPSDVPVLMQLLTLPTYPSPQTILDMTGKGLNIDLNDITEFDEETSVFILNDLEKYNNANKVYLGNMWNESAERVNNPSPNNQVPNLRLQIERELGVSPHNSTVPMIMGPRGKVKIRLGFRPLDDLLRTSILIIRNNLTIIDSVVMQGQGGRGEIRLSNKKAGSQTPLLFELTKEKHLKNCDKKKISKSVPPIFTVKRSFTARNTGQLPFYVHGFSVNDEECEGYGFKILDCSGFDLQPNSSKKIDIVFTPDFTMSRVRRILSVHTSLGPAVNYTLQATIPPDMLSKCGSALPRPSWEPILYYSIVCIMTFILFCIGVVAYFEADRAIVLDMANRRHRLNGLAYDKSKVFDLRNVTNVPNVNGKQPASPTLNNKTSPLKTVATPVAAAAPVVANGHVESGRAPVTNTRKSKKPSYGSYIISLLTYFLSKNSKKKSPPPAPPVKDSSASRLSVKPPTVERQDSSDKENRSPAFTQNSKVNNEKETADDNAKNNNKNIYAKNGPTNGKKPAKATKRHMEYANNNNENNQNKTTNESKTTKPETTRTSVLTNVDENNSQPNPYSKSNATNQKPIIVKKSFPATSTGIDSLEPIEVPIIEDEVLIRATKSQKSRPKSADVKDKRVYNPLIEYERDDSSSTTTESSLDVEDKWSARDSTPDIQPPKAKKTKTKRKGKNKKEDDNEDDFMITSRSKAHRYITVNPNNCGGNILQPASLELPYTTKLEADAKEAAAALQAKEKASRKAQKNANKTRPKGVIRPGWLPIHTGTDEEHPRLPTSSPWDSPASNNNNADFGDLATQTQLFAQSVGRTNTGAASTPQTTASRSNSSYSSVVSGEQAGVHTGKADSKKGSYSPNSIGAIGSQASSVPSSTPNTSRRGNGSNNTWNLSPGTPATPESPMANTFGLDPIKENSSDPASTFGLQELKNLGYINGSNFAGAVQPPNTLMQRLHAQRRKQQMEYQTKLLTGADDWPGFSMPMPIQDSLWDPAAAPTEPWSSLTDSPPKVKASSALWEPTLSNNGSTWNPTTSIWSAGSTGSTSPVDASLVDNSKSGSTSNSPNTTTEGSQCTSPNAKPIGEFDPFNAIDNIWNPATSTGAGTNLWSFPPPSGNSENNKS